MSIVDFSFLKSVIKVQELFICLIKITINFTIYLVSFLLQSENDTHWRFWRKAKLYLHSKFLRGLPCSTKYPKHQVTGGQCSFSSLLSSPQSIILALKIFQNKYFMKASTLEKKSFLPYLCFLMINNSNGCFLCATCPICL